MLVASNNLQKHIITMHQTIEYSCVLFSVTNTYSIRIRVGEHSFYIDEGTETDGKVADIIRHPRYVNTQNEYDIALIKLSAPVDIKNQYIGTACLPQQTDMSYFYQTNECFSTGWGSTRGMQDRISDCVPHICKSVCIAG